MPVSLKKKVTFAESESRMKSANNAMLRKRDSDDSLEEVLEEE